MSYPCPQCCGDRPVDCLRCDFDSKPTQWIADLGAGGWTNRNCDFCDQVSGQYTLDFEGSCIWRYRADNVCTTFGSQTDLIITLSHDTSPPVPGDEWRWSFGVLLSPLSVAFSNVTYATSGTTENDCWHFGGNGSTDKMTIQRFGAANCCAAVFPCNDILSTAVELWAP